MTASHEKRKDGTFVLTLGGKLKTQEIGIKSPHAPQTKDLQKGQLLIDLSGAESISVGALRWLANVENHALEQGKPVIFKGASPEISQVLHNAYIGLFAQFI